MIGRRREEEEAGAGKAAASTTVSMSAVSTGPLVIVPRGRGWREFWSALQDFGELGPAGLTLRKVKPARVSKP